ncbi:MAG: tail protein X [Rhodobacteraceae bacterium]|nr:tail protein X [Paracoccaceae bacterium]
MTIYRTNQGDMLDAICLAELGSEAHITAVLDANPGLAALGPIYPQGVEITLPVIATSTVKTGEVRLWGRT